MPRHVKVALPPTELHGEARTVPQVPAVEVAQEPTCVSFRIKATVLWNSVQVQSTVFTQGAMSTFYADDPRVPGFRQSEFLEEAPQEA